MKSYIISYLTLITITDSSGSLIYGNPMAAVPPTPDTGKPMLAVFSKDEGLTETNICKSRVFIQNASAVKISQFTVHYYFTVENGKAPVLEQYWVPGSTVTLNKINAILYEIRYCFSGELAAGGAVLPDATGNAAGIHYSDWSAFVKTNDFSFPNSSTFVRNGNIAVTDNAGNLIYGRMP